MSYTTTQERKIQNEAVTIAVDVSGGGSVNINVKIGSTWRTMKTVTENDLIEITGKGVEFQVAVTGSVEYEIY